MIFRAKKKWGKEVKKLFSAGVNLWFDEIKYVQFSAIVVHYTTTLLSGFSVVSKIETTQLLHILQQFNLLERYYFLL